tara:strand:+ start:391 stop:582 length:192 start_codon:yes stop_codon:yes gene_type:complete
MIVTLKINGVRKKKMKSVETLNSFILSGIYFNIKNFTDDELKTLTEYVINEKSIRIVLGEKRK